MNLTKDKLIEAWKNRSQIFNDPSNKSIIDRFEFLSKLFKDIEKTSVSYDYNAKRVTIGGKALTMNDGNYPSLNYFGCKDDEMAAEGAFNGVKNMMVSFPDYKDLINKIGCLLGGFDVNDVNDHQMFDEYRIISNAITGESDGNSLTSSGKARHPSSNFADNNYFFNVIFTLNCIKDDNFDPEKSKVVLRYPSDTYFVGTDDEGKKKEQIEILKHRFPYKFFHMWTHRDNELHLVGLMAYQNLVKLDNSEIKYDDNNVDQDYTSFTDSWVEYSNKICNLIPEEDRGNGFFNEMSKLLSLLLCKEQDLKKIEDLLSTGNKAIILHGPPGTGKTYNAKEVVAEFLKIDKGKGKLDDYKFNNKSGLKETGAWDIVQFHPNYTYEDFVGGITPKLSGDELSYEVKTGVFKKICDVANKKENEKKNFVLVIDEINRADLSAVFGELLYALEYRNEQISIPNFDEPFVIPSNVYIIGTMNSIDKSLVTFDLALRRRFGFFKVVPNTSIIENILSEANINIEESCLKNYIARCEELNKEIADQSKELRLGPDYQIGHAYFGKIKDFIKNDKNGEEHIIISSFDLEKLWIYHIEPLLLEYLGNRIDDSSVATKVKELKDNFIKPL